ncbi:hypothetical protein ACFYT3_31845 [Nocardia amikacinitolerans]|uniref:hypothetical protein n=1 Tax=Nocardia amikacinitolerans TaxID=756689 RepID=UPI00368CA030
MPATFRPPPNSRMPAYFVAEGAGAEGRRRPKDLTEVFDAGKDAEPTISIHYAGSITLRESG